MAVFDDDATGPAQAWVDAGYGQAPPGYVGHRRAISDMAMQWLVTARRLNFDGDADLGSMWTLAAIQVMLAEGHTVETARAAMNRELRTIDELAYQERERDAEDLDSLGHADEPLCDDPEHHAVLEAVASQELRMPSQAGPGECAWCGRLLPAVER